MAVDALSVATVGFQSSFVPISFALCIATEGYVCLPQPSRRPAPGGAGLFCPPSCPDGWHWDATEARCRPDDPGVEEALLADLEIPKGAGLATAVSVAVLLDPGRYVDLAAAIALELGEPTEPDDD